MRRSSSNYSHNVMNSSWLSRTLELISNLRLEIVLTAAIGGLWVGSLRHQELQSREGEIPLAFSEIAQLRRDFAAKSQDLPARETFYAKVNDTQMKIFEANNLALAQDRTHKTFAHELHKKMNAELSTHDLINDYLNEIPADAAKALLSMRELLASMQNLPAVRSTFDSAWHDTHRDVTRTEPRLRTRTVTDSEGRSRTETYTEYVTVYEYTIHTYDYNSSEGEKAATLLDKAVEGDLGAELAQPLQTASRTNKENQDAMQSSMQRKLKGRALSVLEYLNLANTWATGSNITKFSPEIRSDYYDLKKISANWNQAKGYAKSERYKTYSRSDRGPEGFQISEAAIDTAGDIERNASKIVDGILYAQRIAPELNKIIHEYVELAQKGGNEKLLGQKRNKIMTHARTMYQKNFEGGFDVQPYKWWDVMLFSMLGVALGVGAGFGIRTASQLGAVALTGASQATVAAAARVWSYLLEIDKKNREGAYEKALQKLREQDQKAGKDVNLAAQINLPQRRSILGRIWTPDPRTGKPLPGAPGPVVEQQNPDNPAPPQP